MNPPYPDRESGGMYLDMQFTTYCNKICNTVISVQPANRIISKTNLGEEMSSKRNLKELDIYDAHDIFNISTTWKYIGVYTYKNNEIFDTIHCINNIHNKTDNINIDRESRLEYFNNLNFNKNVISLCKKLKQLYDDLIDKYNTMVNDGHGFIYEENRLQRGKKKFGVNKKDQQSLSRVKEYLKSGEYKYCLYKGSFNNDYAEVQEWKDQNPDKLFKGQICWLINKENVKNNMKYWMECPLFDLWRKYYLTTKETPGCRYGVLPALDFDQSEDKFKEYVDSLNDFTKDEIKVLKEFKVHNADKL